jgi:hypothetical protein
MTHDPIVDEVRAAREAYAAQFGFDLRAIHQDLKEQQAKSGHRLVQYPARRIQPSAPQDRNVLPAASGPLSSKPLDGVSS